LKKTGKIEHLPDFSTSFIVVGGSTLSRGLTIEGLVSTYFIRDSKQFDTLMQMGRWFGYRKGYELLPRIWMTQETQEKYEYMVSVEHELREELKSYMEPPYVDPKYFGPRVKNSPSLTWFRPTSRNRMQKSEPVEFDFSGANSQTTMFYSNPDILRRNILETDFFLKSLGEPQRKTNANLVWYSVAFDEVKFFLSKFNFHKRAYFFKRIEIFISWFEKTSHLAEYTNWNIVAAGIESNLLGEWRIGSNHISKVKRTRLNRSFHDDSIAIGALRAPTDLVADAGIKNAEIKDYKNKTIDDIREKAGLSKTPQMIIYRISKNSKVGKSDNSKREDLGTEEDIIGISIWIPGVRRSNGNPVFATFLQVDISGDEDLDFSSEDF
jgi:hypothetical protein